MQEKKIALLKKKKEFAIALQEEKRQLEEIESFLANSKADLRVKLEEKNRLQVKRDRVSDNLDIAVAKLHLKRKECQVLSDEATNLDEALQQDRLDHKSLLARFKRLSGELDGTLDQGSQEEADKMQKILQELDTLKLNYQKASKKKRKAERRRNILRSKVESLKGHITSLVSPQTVSSLCRATDNLKEEKKQFQSIISEIKKALEINAKTRDEQYNAKEELEAQKQTLEADILEKRNKQIETSNEALAMEEDAIREEMRKISDKLAQGTVQRTYSEVQKG